MDNNGSKLFSETPHLNREQMMDYLHHRLAGKELHDVEKHLVDCSLCNEALEGAKRIRDESRIVTITHELRRLARKRKLVRRKMFSQLDLVSLFGIVFLIIFLIIIAVVMFIKK
jgi:hypothetical protein